MGTNLCHEIRFGAHYFPRLTSDSASDGFVLGLGLLLLK